MRAFQLCPPNDFYHVIIMTESQGVTLHMLKSPFKLLVTHLNLNQTILKMHGLTVYLRFHSLSTELRIRPLLSVAASVPT